MTTHKKTTKRTRKAILIALVAFSVVIFANFSINIFYNSRTEEIEKYNILATDLGDVDTLPSKLDDTTPSSFIARLVKSAQALLIERDTAQLQERKNKIIVDFVSTIENYWQSIESITTKTGMWTKADLLQLPFSIQKDSAAYLSAQKALLRKQLEIYNLTAEAPLRYELRAESYNGLDNRKLAAKLLVLPVSGYQLSKDTAQFLRDNAVGSVILFGGNVQNEKQLKELTKQLQRANALEPMLIATDQEGGTVRRIGWDTSLAHRQIARLANEEAKCAEWQKRAKLLASLGINWNFGIVADVTGDSRSFIYPRVLGSDYDKVADNVAIAVRCSQQILTTLKHWPGHGATALDTHLKVAKLPYTDTSEWLARDAKPFTSGQQQNVASIMVGHLILSAIDKDLPASLSPKAIDYLRNQQKYSGIIVTDDLNMLTSAGYKLDEAAIAAAKAGSDQLIVVSNKSSDQTRVINRLTQALNNSELNREELIGRLARVANYRDQIAKQDTDHYVRSELVW